MQNLEEPPVMLTMSEFLTETRKVNPLVSLEHCKQLLQQLEVFLSIKKMFFHHFYFIVFHI